MAVLEAKVRSLEGEVAEVMGVLNAAHGRLVALVGRALDEGLWEGWGIHSPGHWLSWQAGMSTARAAAIATIAERRAELPSLIAALDAGELSVDAGIEIAKRAPAGYEESITDFARLATITQLRRCLKTYAYDDATEKAKPCPREDHRSVSMGTDDNGWWLKGRLPADEGKVIEHAIRSCREDLYRQERAATPTGQRVGDVSWADGLLAAAEAALRDGQARYPGTDRYQIHLHLEANPHPNTPNAGDGLDGLDPRTGTGRVGASDGLDRWEPGAGRPGPGPWGPGRLSFHLGDPLPDALRHLLLCDTTIRPVWDTHGTPLNVGRKTRIISRRLRRAIEHRDHGCRVPGCHRTTNLEIHHITHWEHGGPTNTHNLLTLCRHHHRLHHTGHLTITGNPNRPNTSNEHATGNGHDDAPLRFADRWGRQLDPTGTPILPTHPEPTRAANHIGLHPSPYTHPLGERLDTWGVTFNPNDPSPRPTPTPTTPTTTPTGPTGHTHRASRADPAGPPGPHGPPEPPEPPGPPGPGDGRVLPGHHAPDPAGEDTDPSP